MKKPLLSLRKWTALLCLPFALLSSVVNAQVSAYSFTQTNGTYTEITNGGNLATANSTTNLDTYNKLITLPFAFPFNGVNHTTITYNADGAIYLNPTIVSSSSTFTYATSQGVIAAFAGDLRGYYNANHAGTVDTLTTVIGGERVYIIQQKNWSYYSSSNSASTYQVINFQYHLYESGKIQIVYGEFSRVGTSTLAPEPIVGLRGASSADFNTRTNTTAQSFNASTSSTAIGNTQKVNFSAGNVNPGLPANGLTYTWMPPACAPMQVAASNSTTNSVTLTFTSNQSTVFNYEIRTSGAAGSGATGLVASGQANSTTEIVSTLLPSTSYTVYAQGVCGNDLGAWSTGATFATQCEVATLPLFEGFNQSTRPICWTSAIVSGGTTSYLSYPANGSNPTVTPQEQSNMVQYNSYSSSAGNQERLMSPTIDATGIANIMTEFKFYRNNSGSQTDSLILQYSTDNGTTWTRFGGVARLGTNGWITQSHSLPAAAGNSSTLKVGFLFKSAYGYSMFIDSVVIKQIPLPTYTTVNNFNVCTNDAVTATINGINLANATVTIDGVPQVVLTNTFSQITFKVASGTTGTVTVTTPLGQFDIANPITITTPPALALAENTATICASTPYTVNLDSDLANYSTYTWNSNSTNTATGNATDGFSLTSANGYTFIITGTTSINGATCTNKDTIVISTIALPNLAQNFATAVICDNDQKQLSFTQSQGTITTTSNFVTGSDGAPNPFSSHYGGLKTQSIYTAADLTQMGWTAGNPITGITINTITVNPVALSNYRVRMGTTTATTMTTTFISTNLEVVYQGTYQPVLGLNTITFTTPFIWDGTSNVVLEFAHNNSNYGSASPYTTIQTIATPTVTSANYYTDGVAAASTESSIYNRTTASQTISRRILLNFLAETPLVPVTEDYTIAWTGTNLFVDEQGNTPYINEEVNSVYFIPVDGAVTATPTVSVTNDAGCTRTLSYAITVNPTFETILTQEACNFFQYRGNVLSQTGVYRDTLATVRGCDSIVVLNLNITNSTNNYVNRTVCGSYIFDGNQLTTSGVYTATFQTANGCDSTVILNLSIINQVAAYITFSGDTLFAHPSFADVTYQWENCNTGQIIPGANQATFIPQQYGVYRVRVGTGSCIGTSICAVYGVNGIEILDDLELSAYPNPTTGYVTINFASEEEFNAQVVDATGQVIASTKVLSGGKVDLSAFAPGVYTIKLGNEDSFRTVRVIKQ